MDAKALESEALSAISRSSTLEELDSARVHYLGRKSELKQALREVRDREGGMALNQLREQLEQTVEQRRAELERAGLEHELAAEPLDVTLPGTPVPRGHLHLITQIRREVEDTFLGRRARPAPRTVAAPDPRQGEPRPAGVHGLARPGLPAGPRRPAALPVL